MGGGNFDIILALWRPQVSLKFHGGGNFDIILALWRLQVSLKFHGGGNFDIILALWRLQVSLKFHGNGNFDNILLLWTARVIFKFLWELELFGRSVVAELRNLAIVVAQAELHNPGSCAICQKQSR